MFIAMVLCHIIDPKSVESINKIFSLQSPATHILYKPWTLISYSLLNANILQLLCNMLWLFCFGKLLLMRLSPLNLYLIYIAGAVGGGLAFLLMGEFSDSTGYSYLIGSSAAVIAVSVSTAVIMPDIRLYIPILGEVEIKWIVGVALLIFVIGLTAPNAGGNIAHIGGAATGLLYALIVNYRVHLLHKNHNDVYERLMNKIRTSGYDSMSEKEKRLFFQLSHKKSAR